MRITIKPDAPRFANDFLLQGKVLEATPHGDSMVFRYADTTWAVPKDYVTEEVANEPRKPGRPPKERN